MITMAYQKNANEVLKGELISMNTTDAIKILKEERSKNIQINVKIC